MTDANTTQYFIDQFHKLTQVRELSSDETQKLAHLKEQAQKIIAKLNQVPGMIGKDMSPYNLEQFARDLDDTERKLNAYQFLVTADYFPILTALSDVIVAIKSTMSELKCLTQTDENGTVYIKMLAKLVCNAKTLRDILHVVVGISGDLPTDYLVGCSTAIAELSYVPRIATEWANTFPSEMPPEFHDAMNVPVKFIRGILADLMGLDAIMRTPPNISGVGYSDCNPKLTRLLELSSRLIRQVDVIQLGVDFTADQLTMERNAVAKLTHELTDALKDAISELVAPTTDVKYLLAQVDVALAYLCGFPAGWTGAQVKQKLDLGDAPDADARTGGAAQSLWAG